jgi:hypothetical protein
MLRFVAVPFSYLSFVVFDFPFTSVSTVSRSHPSLQQMKGFFPCQYRRFLSSLGCSIVGTVLNIFFPHRTLFKLIFTHPPVSWALGRQPCWVACLLVCVSVSCHGFILPKEIITAARKNIVQEVPHIETRWDVSSSTVRDQYSINLYPYPLTLRKVTNQVEART